MPVRKPVLDPPFNIVRASHVELTATDLGRSRAFYVDCLGYLISDEDSGALYLRAVEERNHHSIVLRKGALASAQALGFKVGSEEDVEKAAHWFRTRNLPVSFPEVPYQGRSLRTADPSGMPLEFYFRMDQRERMLQRYKVHQGARIQRIDHRIQGAVGGCLFRSRGMAMASPSFFQLQVRRIENDQARQLEGRRGRHHLASEPPPRQKRQPATVIEMSMGQQDDVDRRRIEAEVRGVLFVDGRPVPIVVDASTHDMLESKRLPMAPCPSEPTLQLRAGAHVLTAPDPDAGLPDAQVVAVDHVALGSGADGAAVDARVLLGPSDRPAPPAATAQAHGPDAMTVTVPAARGDYWLVLGQSHNDGWHATIGDRDLGPPVLVNGFANGWRIPAALAAKPVVVHLEWTPQRVVRIALWLSALAGLLCIGIVIIGRRRRAAVTSVAADAPSVVETSATGAARHTLTRADIVVALGVGGAAVVFVRPWIGLVVAAATLLAAARPTLRPPYRWAPVVLLGGVAAAMTLVQIARPVARSTEFAQHFSALAAPTWIAVFLLLGEAVLAARELTLRSRDGDDKH